MSVLYFKGCMTNNRILVEIEMFCVLRLFIRKKETKILYCGKTNPISDCTIFH